MSGQIQSFVIDMAHYACMHAPPPTRLALCGRHSLSPRQARSVPLQTQASSALEVSRLVVVFAVMYAAASPSIDSLLQQRSRLSVPAQPTEGNAEVPNRHQCTRMLAAQQPCVYN